MLINRRLPLMYIFKQIQPDVMISMIFAGVLISLEHSVPHNVLEPFQIPVAISAFLGTAISLVLSFMLAQSYDRWWEARKVWGAVVNDSRSLVVQLTAFAGRNPENDECIRRITLRQIGWCFALTNSLRGLGTSPELSRLLSADDLAAVESHANQPLKLVDLNSKDISELHASNQLNDYQQVQVDSTLVRLVTSMGQAERIKNTVFPKTYLLFLRIFIYVFIFSLAVSLADLEAIFEMLLLVLIGMPFFMLKRTALYMQDPFENRPTDTAMLTISKNIEVNLRQLIDDQDVPKIDPPETFFVM
ncbi:MAG TPA: hypothetical protein DCY79_22285 [Planctomycetaceae bacterium]|nr:hypothetical protein [Blastopirellula sp.]HAY82545.1 hypothetical protein [Planctomycetaceae bacterium]